MPRSVSSAQWVEFFNIGLGRILEIIPGSGSGRSFELYHVVFSGTFFTLRGFQVFSGISRFTYIYSRVVL